MTPKLCYVIPEYEDPNSSRYFYIFEFLTELANHMDISVFVETPKKHTSQSFPFPVYYQKISFPFLNLLERLIFFTHLRLTGTKTFYVHYSIFSSLLAAILTRLLGGQTLYWFCQMRGLYTQAFLEELFFKFNLKLITKIVTCTDHMVTYFAETYNVPQTKISVIPLWVNTTRFASEKKNEEALRKEFGLTHEPVVLFVHWLSKRKGAEKIVPLYKLLVEKNKDLKMFVVGDGPLLAELRAQNLPGLKLFGKVGNQAIAKYYAVSTVFLMPSKEEEFGRVLLEAMATSLPIVATKTAGPLAIMTKQQKNYLVDVDNLSEFSAKISEIIASKTLQTTLTADGLKVVKNYELETVAKKFLALTER